MSGDVLIGDMGTKFHRHARRLRARSLIAQHGEGPKVVAAFVEEVVHGRPKDSLAVEVEQLQRPRDHRAQISTVVQPVLEQDFQPRCGLDEAPSAVTVSGAGLGFEYLPTVLGVFDDLLSAPAPGVLGDACSCRRASGRACRLQPKSGRTRDRSAGTEYRFRSKRIITVLSATTGLTSSTIGIGSGSVRSRGRSSSRTSATSLVSCSGCFRAIAISSRKVTRCALPCSIEWMALAAKKRSFRYRMARSNAAFFGEACALRRGGAGRAARR